MKTRQGFVSNSSSTSFTVLVGKEKKCETCGHTSGNLPERLLELVNMGSRETIEHHVEKLSRNIKETRGYIKKWNALREKLEYYAGDAEFCIRADIYNSLLEKSEYYHCPTFEIRELKAPKSLPKKTRLDHALKQVKESIARSEAYIEKCEKQLVALKDCSSDEAVLVMEVDDMTCNSDFEKEMKDAGVVILDREHD